MKAKLSNTSTVADKLGIVDLQNKNVIACDRSELDSGESWNKYKNLTGSGKEIFDHVERIALMQSSHLLVIMSFIYRFSLISRGKYGCRVCIKT